jgi:hypothetical protein
LKSSLKRFQLNTNSLFEEFKIPSEKNYISNHSQWVKHKKAIQRDSDYNGVLAYFIVNYFYLVGSGEVKFSMKKHRKSIEKFIETFPTKYK